MDYYLLALYVSLEQELAIRELFVFKGWNFSKCEEVNQAVLGTAAEVNSDVKTDCWDSEITLEDAVGDIANVSGGKTGDSILFDVQNNAYVTADENKVNGNVSESVTADSLGIDVFQTQNDVSFQGSKDVPDVLDMGIMFDQSQTSNLSTFHDSSVVDNSEKVDLCKKSSVSDKDIIDQSQFDIICKEVHGVQNGPQINDNKEGNGEKQTSTENKGDNVKQRKTERERNDVKMVENDEKDSNQNSNVQQGQSKKFWYCEECKHTFKQKGKFERHKKDGRCVFVCEYCGRSFTSRYYSNYLCHIKYHVGQRPHKCDVCGKTYVEAQTLKIHMRKHSDTRPYICQFCGLRFFSTSALSSHTNRMHNEEYSYSKCDICEALLSTPGNLNEHKKVVHTLERPYVCNVCGKAFKTQKMLEKVHAAVHLDNFPYVCNFANCGKKFKRTDYLANHMKRHNNERTFFCETCDKGFYLKKDLRSHLRVHTGEKPYTCKYCEYRCALAGNLSKHMKKHQRNKIP